MQTPALNKSSLSLLKRRRTMYQRFLPALEMKQRMLLAQRKLAGERLAALRQEMQEREESIGTTLPMLADEGVPLGAPVRVVAVKVTQENLVGVMLPRLDEVVTERQEYGLLIRPHWMDALVEQLEAMLRLDVERRLLERRLRLLDEAARTITQRVNLFSKVIIPTVNRQIQRIDLHLADQERAAVVRGKLAKRKHAEGARS
ncbi:V-type ATP synthase subunit D [Halomonas sp. H5]|uniref:V-type ATP synthase subunit D n=1 Tax=Halomonas sp. H5 TaxID=3423910 RepID=UPI003D36125D